MAFGWHSVDRAGVASGQAPLAQPSGPPAQRWPPTWLSTPTDPRQFAASESSVRHRALCIVAARLGITGAAHRWQPRPSRPHACQCEAQPRLFGSRGGQGASAHVERAGRLAAAAGLRCGAGERRPLPVRCVATARWLPAFASCSGQRRGRCSSPRQATRRRRPSRASQASRRAPRMPACALTASSGWATARPCSSARGEGARCGC